jgi:hypothetical protein
MLSGSAVSMLPGGRAHHDCREATCRRACNAARTGGSGGSTAVGWEGSRSQDHGLMLHPVNVLMVGC